MTVPNGWLQPVVNLADRREPASDVTGEPNGDGTITWSQLAGEAAASLVDAGVDNAASEARWIVEVAAGMDDGALGVEGSGPATVGGVNRVWAMVGRRSAGEPLQYVLGQWSFRTLNVMVDPRVLIPRPETEQVVEVALGELASLAERRSPGAEPPVVVDLGTGSGAIALSIAAEWPQALVVATDVSTDALAVTQANLAGIGMAGASVRLAHGSWFQALGPHVGVEPGGIDLVISNPPYVAADEPLPDEVANHEPHRALVSGPLGTEDLHVVIKGAARWLRPGGVVIVELAPHQAAPVAGVAADAGLVDVRIEHDLTGRDRMVVAYQPGQGSAAAR